MKITNPQPPSLMEAVNNLFLGQWPGAAVNGATFPAGGETPGRPAATRGQDEGRPSLLHSSFFLHSSPARRGGYTLIEFVAVLAVVAILAAMLIPVVINNLQTSELNAEYANLANMDNTLVLGIERTYQIPGTNWASLLGNWLMYPTASITTNAGRYGRAYVYDTNGFGSLTLPYTQTNGLASAPPNPRLMIISSLSANVPVVSGPLQSNYFAAIWSAAPGAIPSYWTNNPAVTNLYYGGQGATLVIQRINLAPLFHRLVLNAVDTNDFGSINVQSGTNVSPYICVLTNSLTNTLVTAWSLNGATLTYLSGPVFTPNTGAIPIPAVNAYYLQGTVIGFYDTNNGYASPNLETQLIVQQDASYVFEDQSWHGLLSGWGTNGPAGMSLTSIVTSASSVVFAQGFTTTGKTFETCPLNYNDSGGTSRGDSCEALYGAFHTFMMDYNNWCRESYGAGSDNACTRLLNDDQNSIYNLTQNMCQ